MLEIDPDAFAAAHAAGALVIDVREAGEYTAGHVPGARLAPRGRLASVLPRLPRVGRVYVICASGNRSESAAGLLRRAGLEAYSVAGGTFLLVIAANSAAALLARTGHLQLHWTLLGPFLAAAVAGSLAGHRIADRLPAAALTRAFATLLVLIASPGTSSCASEPHWPDDHHRPDAHSPARSRPPACLH